MDFPRVRVHGGAERYRNRRTSPFQRRRIPKRSHGPRDVSPNGVHDVVTRFARPRPAVYRRNSLHIRQSPVARYKPASKRSAAYVKGDYFIAIPKCKRKFIHKDTHLVSYILLLLELHTTKQSGAGGPLYHLHLFATSALLWLCFFVDVLSHTVGERIHTRPRVEDRNRISPPLWHIQEKKPE